MNINYAYIEVNRSITVCTDQLDIEFNAVIHGMVRSLHGEITPYIDEIYILCGPSTSSEMNPVREDYLDDQEHGIDWYWTKTGKLSDRPYQMILDAAGFDHLEPGR